MNNTLRIETEKEYKQVLKRIEEIFDAEPGTKEGKELDALATLAVNYEEINMPMD